MKEKKKHQRHARDLKNKILEDSEKDDLIIRQKQEISRLRQQINYRNRKITRLTTSLQVNKDTFHSTIDDISLQNKTLQHRITELNACIEDLEIQLTNVTSEDDIDIETRVGSHYNTNIRKCIYRQIQSNTPVTQCGDILTYIISTLDIM